MNRIVNIILGISTLSLMACSGETVEYSGPKEFDGTLPDVTPPAIASAPLSTISHDDVANTNEFAVKFYLANSNGSNENVCVSPFSVESVLAMIANGSDGVGRDEILTCLGFEASETGLRAMNKHYQTILSNLPNMEEEITCNFTNSIWYDPLRSKINSSFMQQLNEYYYATEIGIAPGGENGMNAINQFVSNNTNGVIDNFLSTPINSEVALLNTAYFKAGWNDPFFKSNTSTGVFKNINGKDQKTDFMSNYSIYKTTKTSDGTEAVRLFYGNDSDFSMTLLLPPASKKPTSPDKVLTTANIKEIENNLSFESFILKLPKFEVEQNNPRTNEILKELGLEETCSGRAAFSKVCEKKDFYLDCFIHAAKLKVDEEGSEGAAASLGGSYGANIGNENTFKPREIVFDRPFAFYIQENTTGCILFVGSVKKF